MPWVSSNEMDETGAYYTEWSQKEKHQYSMLLLLSCSVVSDSVQPHRWQPTRLLSLGFSGQEYWSGLPFLSPMHGSEKWKWSHCHVRLFVTPWTAAHQAPPFMGFPRQEYWSGVPLPSPNYLSECVANSCWFTNLKAGILKQILCLHLFLGICVSYLPLKRE